MFYLVFLTLSLSLGGSHNVNRGHKRTFTHAGYIREFFSFIFMCHSQTPGSQNHGVIQHGSPVVPISKSTFERYIVIERDLSVFGFANEQCVTSAVAHAVACLNRGAEETFTRRLASARTVPGASGSSSETSSRSRLPIRARQNLHSARWRFKPACSCSISVPSKYFTISSASGQKGVCPDTSAD